MPEQERDRSQKKEGAEKSSPVLAKQPRRHATSRSSSEDFPRMKASFLRVREGAYQCEETSLGSIRADRLEDGYRLPSTTRKKEEGTDTRVQHGAMEGKIFGRSFAKLRLA